MSALLHLHPQESLVRVAFLSLVTQVRSGPALHHDHLPLADSFILTTVGRDSVFHQVALTLIPAVVQTVTENCPRTLEKLGLCCLL